MMREIKFRYVFKKPSGHIVKYFTDIQHLEHGDMANFLQFNFLSVERDLISRDEFIEPKDKNGKEVYEGDIIRFPKGADYPADYDKASTFYIEWDGGCCYSMVGIKPESVNGSEYSLADLDLSDCKVIGNIYENPELLEAK